MKFTETTYSNGKEILKFPDHYVNMPVTVDDTGIEVNADGKKLVPKGTIVGGVNAPVLQDPTQMVAKKNTGSVAASATLVPAGDNNDIVITAKTAGVEDNSIWVELRDPAGNDKDLAVLLEGDAIVVSLSTSAAGAITSTAAQVIEAINKDLDAKQLVVASNAADNDGTGVVTAITATPLAGGTASAGSAAEGVLFNEVDVTYGPAAGAMLIHGFLDVNKLPEAPSAEAIAALDGRIVFLK